ncbi:DNA phosphorothioation-dependent restriction protein DptF [Bacterioplanoides sp. SCSIO 12839]|uniref:DNA phosphorothioation-dependent restriction protein DptF n=1 Tax=Bacterioplanoides sp. SCSIO 12839 TaxID=2829569 RepID=UPI00210519D2|nr:DNA phosphorothioation-dependent restriction protein DptF [Bacterioplanoides sp. SCSIO 12839]UTW49820.1 DNA phosphorothioation-dependent restriction protein DptF [Bacterioplanoides sp. SCSIO 12839]
MNFLQLLETLARSSAEAVSTLSKSSDEVEDLRSYLYVETEIESRFLDALKATGTAQSIIFICGSSGDGKSEILRRHHSVYKDDFLYHLDATHSFKPDQSAVEALNELFDRHQSSDKPLIVGINIGMLFNFQNSGDERHEEIKQAIGRFISGERSFDNYQFLSFEDYPKFSLDEGKVGSDFVSELLAKVTAADEKNPLYRAYLKDADKYHQLVYQNYRILQEPEVQALIVQTLLHARLKYDQFLSARALLDFIYNLIAGDSVLFDNLFLSPGDGLSNSLRSLDPCLLRSQRIDEFVVQRSLSVLDSEFDEFKSAFMEKYGNHEMPPNSWVRAFYVLIGVDVGNNYHKAFSGDFRCKLFEDYIHVWQLHQTLNDKKQLREFYDKTLIASLIKFANRLLTGLGNDGIYLAERNGVTITTKLRIAMDTKALESPVSSQIHSFNAAIKVGDESIKTFPVTISFLELAERIMSGYRPNRHDKNTIVILEEVIDEVAQVASRNGSLTFIKDTYEWSLLLEDDEFIVEAC